MKPKKVIVWTLSVAVCVTVLVLSLVPTKRWADDVESNVGSMPTSGECSPIISGEGTIVLECNPLDCGPGDQCGPGLPIPPPPNPTACILDPALCSPDCPGPGCPGTSFDDNCITLGVAGPCLDRALFSGLERAEYAFNAPQEMAVSEPYTIALVIDTTGQTDFSAELMALPGVQVEGETPISLIMEGEIVGPAFEITPSGRQRRELSELNPTRWDWEVTPTRGGEHQLEVSLYVIASRGGESIGEEKALAERHVILVTVSPLNRLTDFIVKVDPILAFVLAIGGAIAAVLAWFGLKSWRDVSGADDGEAKPQKIEVTIKEASGDNEK